MSDDVIPDVCPHCGEDGEHDGHAVEYDCGTWVYWDAGDMHTERSRLCRALDDIARLKELLAASVAATTEVLGEVQTLRAEVERLWRKSLDTEEVRNV